MPKFYLSINATARVCAEDHFSAPSLADAIAKVKADGLAAFNFTLDDDQDDGRNLDGPATAYLFDDENGAGWENDPLAEIPLGSPDPVKAEMLAALKAAMDDGFLAGEVLDQVAAAIDSAEGRA